MASNPPLASLSLTHVHYNSDDPISYLCAWLALVPQALCVVYASLIWSSREIEILLLFAGQMGCEAFNFVLKRLIKEERPAQMNGKGYGMPSSHAQFATFFSVSLSLFLLLRHTPPSPTLPKGKKIDYTNPEYYHLPLTVSQRSILSGAALLLALAVSLSRIYLEYHTPLQVLVGCGAGAVSAVLWFALTGWLRSEGWIRWGVDTWPGRVWRFRDLVVEEDLAEAGWRRWCERTEKKNLANGGSREGKKVR